MCCPDWSNQDLYLPLESGRVHTRTYESYVDGSGVQRVNGLHANLKSTQAYPPAFGLAIANHHLTRSRPMGEGVLASALSHLTLSEDAWDDAEVVPLLAELGVTWP